MANTKITIDHTLVKGDKWYNMKYNGKDAGISVASAPKTIAAINSGVIEVEVNLVEKDGKYYFWDKQEPKQGSGNKFQMTPEQLAAKQAREDHTQRMIVAQSCYASTCNLKQQTSIGHDEILVLTKKAYDFIMEISK